MDGEAKVGPQKFKLILQNHGPLYVNSSDRTLLHQGGRACFHGASAPWLRGPPLNYGRDFRRDGPSGLAEVQYFAKVRG